ncbi:MAG: hypothetical protein MK066_13335 [Crocinitomicaceae bacterium]|nr:hypothetical protein [Crocinitomicaceae bacterium]
MEKWQDGSTIALWIVIALILVSILVVSIIIIVRAYVKRMLRIEEKNSRIQIEHQRMLLETNIKAQEKERERMAADLHDDLIGKLNVALMMQQTGQNQDEIEGRLQEGISLARRISHDLSPPMIDFQSLAEILEGKVNPWKARFEADYIADIRGVEKECSSIKIQVMRIVQEVIMNIIKHANSKSMYVRFRYTDAGGAIIIEDKGDGFDTKENSGGLGLSNIETRVQFIHGKFKFKSILEKGTRFILIFPKSTK